MNKPTDAHKRKVLEQMKAAEKRHQERQGKIPSSREIEKTYAKMAEKNDRQKGW